MIEMGRGDARNAEIRRLYRRRPRRRFVFWSAMALLGLVLHAWSSDELRGTDLLSQRRLENLERFLGELRPAPLHGRDWDTGAALEWAARLMREKGWQAAGTTLALSVAAMVLAGLASSLLAPLAARTLATAEPYLPDSRPPGRGRVLAWRALVSGVRLALIILRSIPEYVWAFLFLSILGPTAWPVVLALALHNAGILSKLTAEVVENLPPSPLAALRGLGASRSRVAVVGLFPLTLPRFLLFFFYRWETCVREATVLGLLGIASLGYWIVDTRARQHYDEMFFFVLVGAGLVLVGDLVSSALRELVRRRA